MIDEKKLIKDLRRSCENVQAQLKAASLDPVETMLEFALTSQLTMLLNIINKVKAQPKVGEWILTSDRLPPEPQVGRLDGIEELESAIERKKISEYLVTIEGATEATTLWYAGDGRWYDCVTGDYYTVIAWQQLPEAYQPQ